MGAMKRKISRQLVTSTVILQIVSILEIQEGSAGRMPSLPAAMKVRIELNH